MDIDLTVPINKSANPIASEGHREQQPVAVRYIDRADMEETFVDSIAGFIFDGQTLRIEFGVTRYDEMKGQFTDDRPPLSCLPLGNVTRRCG